VRGGVFDAELVQQRTGFASVLFQGKGARALFANEAGGHRFQRIPPGEKRGRVHTSTVTVATLDPEVEASAELDESEVAIRRTRGGGPGGQHRNKVESCVVAVHRETGIRVRADMRSQHASKAMALQILAARVRDQRERAERSGRDAHRREQVGSGMRGDKVRTYRTQDDRVTDHRSGRTFRLATWLRGAWDELDR
jgi:peptide chain release factor 1